MNEITIFTPTFNRAYILKDAYNSLLSQSEKKFIWIIIDDGSSDGTNQLVSEWLLEGRLNIVYQWKPNGGMHTAHNVALDLIETELCFCLDSDDQLKPNAIEIILKHWKSLPNKESTAGIVMHENYITSGERIGSAFPIGITKATFKDLYYRYGVKGDKLLIYRAKLLKENVYPVFNTENFVPLDYKYLLIDQPLSILEDSIYQKEYLTEGYSKNIVKIYAKNPVGFAFYHAFRMKKVDSLFTKIKSSIHLTACLLLSKQNQVFSRSPMKILTLFTLPLGLLRFYQLIKEKKSLAFKNYDENTTCDK